MISAQIFDDFWVIKLNSMESGALPYWKIYSCYPVKMSIIHVCAWKPSVVASLLCLLTLKLEYRHYANACAVMINILLKLNIFLSVCYRKVESWNVQNWWSEDTDGKCYMIISLLYYISLPKRILYVNKRLITVSKTALFLYLGDIEYTCMYLIQFSCKLTA